MLYTCYATDTDYPTGYISCSFYLHARITSRGKRATFSADDTASLVWHVITFGSDNFGINKLSDFTNKIAASKMQVVFLRSTT